ncbi:MAG: hypothetical protein H0V60_06985 [Actinobacteria bacterium]|nr:hypothetical protein [Actinomycetota bacterium]
MGEFAKHWRRTVRRGRLTLGLVLAVLTMACTQGRPTGGVRSSDTPPIPQPTHAQLAAAKLAGLPVAPESERVDIAGPTFSDPTNITNPLFPINDLRSAILSGRVDDKPFHTETTLLPETRIIEWAEGEVVKTRVSQYVAYLDGRLQETALDFYAQADDGSVWYFGEEVFDYRDGAIFSTEGTWLAGRDGPPAMIMPGDPQVGDVHRAENIPGVAFEEVAITTVGKTVEGPTGPVKGALVGRELHDDGTFSDKVFAPGYGEFFSAHEGDVEAMALAVPSDALHGPVPEDLDTLSGEADGVFQATRSRRWRVASVGLKELSAAWDHYGKSDVPPRLAREMNRAVASLTAALRSRHQAPAGTAAIDVAQVARDLRLRYEPPADIDLARMKLWARQILVDAGTKDLGGLTGDVATLEWTRERIAHTLAKVDVVRIDTHLLALNGSVADEDFEAGSTAAQRLIHTLAGIGSASTR